MKPLLNVSKGQPLEFLADSHPMSGAVLRAHKDDPLSATVLVRTEMIVPKGAQLALPVRYQAGGCGLADPVWHDGAYLVTLTVSYDCVDLNTIGK
jgi:hypothetical protein